MRTQEERKEEYKRKYTKEYGASDSSILCLCEADGIEGRNRDVIADSWFGGISFILGLSNLVLQATTKVKTGTAGYCKNICRKKYRYMIYKGGNMWLL